MQVRNTFQYTRFPDFKIITKDHITLIAFTSLHHTPPTETMQEVIRDIVPLNGWVGETGRSRDA